MATNYTNDQLDSYTSVDTAPDRYSTKTGTIDSVGVLVIGTGTLFTSEIGGGSNQVALPTIIGAKADQGYLFNGVNEVRKIKAIISDTSMVLENGFTNNLSAAAVRFVPSPRAIQMSYVILTAGCSVNGVTLPVNQFNGWGYSANTVDIVDPVVVDGTTGSGVLITKFYQTSR